VHIVKPFLLRIDIPLYGFHQIRRDAAPRRVAYSGFGNIQAPNFFVSFTMQIEVPQIDPTLWKRFSLEARHWGTEVSELLSEALR
jgi:hypothetical protein